MTTGLLDTSVFIANESGRPLATDALPDESVISVVTLAELELGVIAATETATRARRLGTLQSVGDMTVLPVDAAVGRMWAALVAHVRETGRRVNVNDLWIAATAVASDLDLVTADADFDAVDGVAGLRVVRV